MSKESVLDGVAQTRLASNGSTPNSSGLRYSARYSRRWPNIWLSRLSGRSARLFAVGLLSALAIASPGQAADKIFFKRGSLVRSLPIRSLETFVADGTVDDELAFYFQITGADTAAQESFRQALQQAPPVDPNLVSQVLYSGIGEDLLTQFGELVQSRAGLNGGLALRSALVTASNSPEGLSLLNVLRALPTDMQIDLEAVGELRQTVEGILQTTTDSVATLGQTAGTEAARESPVDYATLPDLTRSGPYGVVRRRITVTRTTRGDLAEGDRTFYVDLYQPQGRQSSLVPVLIFSHGLSAAPEGYRGRLQHLASHGFLVAAPQHLGSDAQY
ncbi:MAG TPA: alpha/beta hydrolase, partial [Trichocoleus sp.]